MRVKIILCYVLIIISFSCSNSSTTKSLDKNVIYGFLDGDNLIYSSWNKQVVVENLVSRDTLFIENLKDTSYVKPVLRGDVIFFKNSDSTFKAFDINTKKTLWDIQTKNKSNNFIVLNDTIGLLNVKNESIIGIDLLKGKEVYNIEYNYKECVSPDLSPYPISYDKSKFYVNDWQCETIRAFDIKNGKQIWSRTLSKGLSRAVLFQDKIFVGVDDFYKTSKIFILDSNNGDTLKSFDNVNISLRILPVLWKATVIYYDYSAKSLMSYDFEKDKLKAIKSFDKSNFITGQFYLLGNSLYYQDNNFEIIKLDLLSFEEKVVMKSSKGGFSAIYLNDKNEEIIIY